MWLPIHSKRGPTFCSVHWMIFKYGPLLADYPCTILDSEFCIFCVMELSCGLSEILVLGQFKSQMSKFLTSNPSSGSGEVENVTSLTAKR